MLSGGRAAEPPALAPPQRHRPGKALFGWKKKQGISKVHPIEENSNSGSAKLHMGLVCLNNERGVGMQPKTN